MAGLDLDERAAWRQAAESPSLQRRQCRSAIRHVRASVTTWQTLDESGTDGATASVIDDGRWSAAAAQFSIAVLPSAGRMSSRQHARLDLSSARFETPSETFVLWRLCLDVAEWRCDSDSAVADQLHEVTYKNGSLSAVTAAAAAAVSFNDTWERHRCCHHAPAVHQMHGSADAVRQQLIIACVGSASYTGSAVSLSTRTQRCRETEKYKHIDRGGCWNLPQLRSIDFLNLFLTISLYNFWFFILNRRVHEPFTERTAKIWNRRLGL